MGGPGVIRFATIHASPGAVLVLLLLAMATFRLSGAALRIAFDREEDDDR